MPRRRPWAMRAIITAIGAPERHGDVGLIPLFCEFENVATRDNVQGYVSYPDGIPVLSKLSLG